MLGVVTVEADDPADRLLRAFGDEIGADRTYAKTRVGVFFGTPGEAVADPFFGGAGPARTGCVLCGRCMVGCPHGAKAPRRGIPCGWPSSHGRAAGRGARSSCW
jgi:cholesterol oxidase